MDTMLTPEQLEFYEERKKAAEEQERRGKKYALITNIEFRRVIMHISGELKGFDSFENLSARFVTRNRTLAFYPQSFELEGNRFHLSFNIMSVNCEKPVQTGNYYLVLFREYDGMEAEFSPEITEDPNTEIVVRSGTVYRITYDDEGNVSEKLELTSEYPSFISPEFECEINKLKDNPLNFRLRRSASNLFYCDSLTDMDTMEYSVNVKYKEPLPPQTLFRRIKKRWKERRDRMVKDLNAFNLFLYKGFFRLFAKFAKKKGNVILFASGSRAEIGGNEKFIYDRMIERGLDKKYKFRFDFKESINIKRNSFKMLRFTWYLATSDIIIIDDYYPEIYKVDYPPNVKILQVWHACGAFKSLGFERLGKPGAPPFNTRVHKCYTHVPVSSYHSAKHHAEGFGIDESKFYPVGIPRTDIFFDEEYKTATRERMLEEFPACKTASKVYLYAPTFRGDNAENAYFPFDKFDLDVWGNFLRATNSVLIIKLHPFVTRRVEIPPKYSDIILDASDYREVNDILFIVDVLITDYSSIIYEMSLLRKPMLFFAFDQKYYEATRDFYEPYEELVPGKIVHSFEELMEAMKNGDYQFHKMDSFIKKNFTYTDGKATDRVIDRLIIGLPEDKDGTGKD